MSDACCAQLELSLLFSVLKSQMWSDRHPTLPELCVSMPLCLCVYISIEQTDFLLDKILPSKLFD